MPPRSNDPSSVLDFHKQGPQHASLRRSLQVLVNQQGVKFVLAVVNSVLSSALIVLFIHWTYTSSETPSSLWGGLNFCGHLYFLLVYLLELYTTKDLVSYLFSFKNFIEFMSVLPYFVAKAISGEDLFATSSAFYMQLANVCVFLRIYSLEQLIRYMDTEINKQLMKIVLVISTLIFGYSALILVFERASSGDPSSSSYHYMIYFVLTTVSTVGYENNLSSGSSKVLLILLIVTGLFILPSKCAQLMELISSESMYVRRGYKVVPNTSHIIITGSISDIAANDFLNEFFHEDHGDQHRHCLILQPQRPQGNIENIINSAQHHRQVFYLQGDSLNEKDLKRCQAEKSKAIVLLCNKQSADPNYEDSKTILQAIVIKKYLKSNNVQNVKICMQLLRPEGKSHYYLSLNKQSSSDQVICVEELKLSLLAKSCLCSGLMAFFTNLITSSGDVPRKQEIEYQWLYEYWQGKGFEIYKAQLSSWFTGKTFSLASAIIYEEFKAIVFALEIGNEETNRIFTNPGQFIIPEHFKVTVYCITEDKSIADLISQFKATDVDMLYRTRNNVKQVVQQALSLQDEDEEEEEAQEDTLNRDIQFKLKNDNLNFIGDRRKREENYHITHNKILLSDVTFKSMEKNILATNHIVLCGMVPNLINFILPLRSKNLNHYPPVVILHTHKPSDKQWSQIADYPEIYFIKGNAMNERDILKINIHRAQKVVILSPNVNEIRMNQFQGKVRRHALTGDEYLDYRNLTRDQEDLLDARTIFKYKAIIKIRPDIPIVTEMVCPQNLQFLQPNPNDYALMKKYSYAMTPNFASGEIFLSSTLDTLICQSFYNPSLITILNHLLIGSTSNQQKNDEFSDVKTSNLYHLAVPFSFYGQTFDKLFKYLIKKQNILTLGLYRLPGCKDNRFPYIVTNPEPGTILTEKDKVFILAQKIPPANSNEWGAPLEVRQKQTQPLVSQDNNHYDDFINIDDKLDIESKKIKKLFEENKVVCAKIRGLVQQLKSLKENNNEIMEVLRQRENQLLLRIQEELKEEVAQLVAQQKREQLPFEEQMMTASEPSSLPSKDPYLSDYSEDSASKPSDSYN